MTVKEALQKHISGKVRINSIFWDRVHPAKTWLAVLDNSILERECSTVDEPEAGNIYALYIGLNETIQESGFQIDCIFYDPKENLYRISKNGKDAIAYTDTLKEAYLMVQELKEMRL